MPIVWSAGHNMPGYLPESDPAAFRTRKEALGYTVEELRRAADSFWDTLPREGSEQEDYAEDYERAADGLAGRDADVDGDWYETFEDGRIAYWFESVDLPADEAREALGEDA
jgi:hypothetical protein